MKKYKIGDKVRIKSREWYDANKDSEGMIGAKSSNGLNFVSGMSKYCGAECTITEAFDNVNGDKYCLLEDKGEYGWSGWMFDEGFIENGNGLNLCKILKGCEGVIVYTTIYGYVKIISVSENKFSVEFTNNYEDIVDVDFLPNGTVTDEYDAECLVFPSKEQRDWTKFCPVRIDDPFMCSDSEEIHNFSIRFYAGIDKNGHYTYTNGGTSKDHVSTCHWKYMIPFNRFDPYNFKESLKYNIQK